MPRRKQCDARHLFNSEIFPGAPDDTLSDPPRFSSAPNASHPTRPSFHISMDGSHLLHSEFQLPWTPAVLRTLIFQVLQTGAPYSTWDSNRLKREPYNAPETNQGTDYQWFTTCERTDR